ncbi:MAG: GNAT family N-acetyltransferase [Bacillaceae bacterium]|nr:GNAT family N-acetyltransferase [Bacillaceae bacterium]
MKVRKAVIGEEKTLSELAVRSKAYWGYDDTFLEKVREDLTVSQKNISSNQVYVLEKENEIIGFFYLNTRFEESELESFFVDPDFIGKGYGRLLWDCLNREG